MDPNDPRATRSREAIVRAAVEVISSVGIARATMDGIARQAGVSRSTLYRHFSDFGDLLFVALDEIAPASPPLAGTTRDQLEATLLGLGRALQSGPWGAIVASIIERAQHDPDVRRHHARFTQERRAPLVALVRRAVDERLITAEADADQVATLLAAPLYYRHLVLHRPMSDREIRAHLDSVLGLVERKPTRPTGGAAR